ncbi:phasin family protein [Albidovulum sediminis]|uniref:Phasin family protein n=1 Tax=Albidovulum sediminis TaxID=3066345 RepID=A0ABT2NIW7_9RHOB|nr:phasin family protein [Defluviimonas sediminis]MCT8328863.1 phasin family protein [Defluviimonas sediminis]
MITRAQTKADKQTSGQAGAGGQSPMAGFTALPAGWFSTEAIEKLGDMGAEYMDFLAERIREDVRTQHAILHCKDPADLRKVQEDFLKTAADQYAAQAGRMTELTNAFMAALMLPRIDD